MVDNTRAGPASTALPPLNQRNAPLMPPSSANQRSSTRKPKAKTRADKAAALHPAPANR